MRQKYNIKIILFLLIALLFLPSVTLFTPEIQVYADGDEEEYEQDPEYYRHGDYKAVKDSDGTYYLTLHSKYGCGNSSACPAMGEGGHLSNLKSKINSSSVSGKTLDVNGETWWIDIEAIPKHYKGAEQQWAAMGDAAREAKAVEFASDFKYNRNCGEKRKKTDIGNGGVMSGPHFQQWGGDIHNSGCTVLTLQMIIQNSNVLQGSFSEYQLTGGNYVQSTDKGANDLHTYGEWDTKIGGISDGFQSGLGDGWTLGNFPSSVSTVSDGKVTATLVTENSDFLTEDAGSGTFTAFIGMGSKKFEDMTWEEFTEAMKVFYEAGYWCAICVWYDGNHISNNSVGQQGANHATAFAGFDKDGVGYIYDPGSSAGYSDFGDRYYSYSEEGNFDQSFQEMYNNKNKYRPSYVVAWEFSNGKMKDVLGGESQRANEDVAEDIGIDGMIKNGFYSEDELSAYCRLGEVNIDELYLLDATLNNLTQDEVQAVDTWKENIGMNDKDKGLVGILRKGIQLLGILITLWAVFFYIAYWFDRLNNFADIDLINILSFGKFRISDTEEESTWKMLKGGSGQRTVNHRNVITIVVIAMAFGALLMTGTIYKLISWLVLKIIHLFR